MKIRISLLVALLLACGIYVDGQTTAPTNRAGAPFPTTQWMPPMLTVRSRTTANGMTRLQGVEIRTMGIVLRADEADVNTSTGEYELRGNVRATLIPVKPMFSEPQ